MNTRLPDAALRRLLEQKLDNGDIDSACDLVAALADRHERALALTKALQRRNVAAVEGFMEAGADPLVKNSRSGVTALTVAVRMEDVEMLKLLLKKHLPLISLADNKRQQSKVQLALDEALNEAASCCSVECLDFLLECGASCNVFFYHSDSFLAWCTPLVAACYAVYSTTHINISPDRALAVIQRLVGCGADIHRVNHHKDSPLFWAAAAPLEEAVSLLLCNGADVNQQNVFGQTPLMNLGERYDDDRSESFVNAAEVLIRHGADLGLTDKDGWTGLHYAAQIGALPLVKLLLTNGANPNHDPTRTKEDPYSCLYFAVNRENLEMVELLLCKNADLFNDTGDISPLKLSCKLFILDIATVLFHNGAMEPDLVDLISDVLRTLKHTASKAELKGWQDLQKCAAQPRSLKIISRIVICKCLGTRLLDDKFNLPLPVQLVNYLKPFVTNNQNDVSEIVIVPNTNPS